MFMGEYHHNLDDKNRLVIPSVFRSMLGPNFIITRGLERCLAIYTLEEWQKIVVKLSSLYFTKKNARIFSRAFFSAAANCELDRQGRITISPNHLSYANITKECVIAGVSDRLEIWSEDEWNNFNAEYSSDLENIAEHLFTGGNIETL